MQKERMQKDSFSKQFEFDRKIAETGIFGKNKMLEVIHRTGATINLFLNCIAMNESAVLIGTFGVFFIIMHFCVPS